MNIEEINTEAVVIECQDILDSLPVEASVTEYFKFPASWSEMGGEELRFFRLDSRTKSFTTEIPVWAGKVYIFSGESRLLKDVQFTAWGFDGRRIDRRLTVSDGKAFASVNYLISRFEIKAGKGASPLNVDLVKVEGFSLDGFSKAVRRIDLASSLRDELSERVGHLGAELDSIKNDYSHAKDEYESLIFERGNLIESIKSLESERERSSAELEGQRTVVTKLKLRQSELQAKENLLTNNVAQLTEQSAEINRRIAQENAELIRLANDRNLISDEYRDYVKEGKAQSKVYGWLAVIPMLVIVFSVVQIYMGAANILSSTYEGLSGLLSAFAQRIPFTLVLGAVIFYSWILISRLFGRIFEIHNDRLTLARLLIIAKDTVFSSAQGLDVSDEVKLRERSILKIQLLKGHLSRDLGSEFEYRSNKGTPLEKSPDTEAS